MDANGDGVGDFRGLMRRLDYLHGLGVTAIWLMPFQPSSLRDGGYDITDYYGVDPRYGTLGDFVEVQAAWHTRSDRPGGQPYIRPAPVVPGGEARSGIALP
jgi:maltose alpha-D-glucosyltransferase/alpha-amylase